MRNVRFLALALVALVALACQTGSIPRDQAAAADVGATAGTIAAVATPEALDPAVAPLVAAVTSLAGRLGAAQAQAADDAGADGLNFWTELLIGIGAAGAAFTASKTGVRMIVKRAKPAESAPPDV